MLISLNEKSYLSVIETALKPLRSFFFASVIDIDLLNSEILDKALPLLIGVGLLSALLSGIPLSVVPLQPLTMHPLYVLP